MLTFLLQKPPTPPSAQNQQTPPQIVRVTRSASLLPQGCNHAKPLTNIVDYPRPELRLEEAMHTSESRMIQKHPATFQCTLCPKRFTRAFSLRNHLRAHGDVRPFVCSVCGRAFTRENDRKSHEGLHSGEKKFVCEGDLRAGGQWGCGRRFARASNLGRHFRSECGRVCIKPLLDEEMADRKAAWERERMEAWERRATALEPSTQAAAIWPAYGPQHRAAS